jgi:hypothetical protein
MNNNQKTKDCFTKVLNVGNEQDKEWSAYYLSQLR